MGKSAFGKKSAFVSDPLHWNVLGNSPIASSRTDDIWFFDACTGWLVNSSGYICKTTDGGDCWAPKFYLCPSSPGKPYLRCMGWGNEQVGWFGSVTGVTDAADDPSRYLNTLLHHTTDGGETWSAVTNLPEGSPAGICGFYAVNENVAYGAGTNDPALPGPGVIKTTDGGANWQLIDMSPHADNLIDIYFFDEQRGIVVGGKNRAADQENCQDNSAAYPPPRLSAYARLQPVVLRTEDGGQSWTNVGPDFSDNTMCGEWGWKIQFIDDQTGFVSLENFAGAAILKTTDGGSTWTRHAVVDQCGKPINKDLEGIGFINESQGWVGGWGNNYEGNMNCYTEDGGETWISQDHNPAVAHSDPRRRINRYRFIYDHDTGELLAGYCSGEQVYKLVVGCADKKAAFCNKEADAQVERLEPACSGDALVAQQAMHREAVQHDYRLAWEPLEDGKVAIHYTPPENAKNIFVGLWNQFAFYVKTLVNGKPAGEADAEGRYTVIWDGADEAGKPAGSGAFICRLSVDGREGGSQNLRYAAP